MSGGVDSSVAAMLLVEQGYDVTGAFMKQWSDSKEISGVCTWKDDRRDAMRVAAHLCIPLITLDFEKEYKEWVMGYMFEQYEAGRTPNPDVMCNKYIKFGAWMEKVKELGYDYLATGHYARVKKEGKNFVLGMAEDSNKDQSYFLHPISSEDLSMTLFPLGDFKKDEVRALAKKGNLPTANRAESMGICFVGEVPIKEFLEQKIDHKPGDIVFTDGTVLGQHDGLSFYTIGQRNTGVQSSNLEKGGDNKPLYVLKKDFDKNELVVGFEDDPLLYSNEIDLEEFHLINPIEKKEIDCLVRFRHRGELQEAKLLLSEAKKATVVTKELQKAITPGQFAVIYKDGICLGGGIVDQARQSL